MKIVAHMPVRNDADIIAEAVHQAFRWIDNLIVLDGESDDGTLMILSELARRYDGAAGKRLYLYREQDRGGKRSLVNLNIVRARLMEITGMLSPDWVLSIDSDEIWHTDPVEAIVAAERAGANVVRCHVPQFWLTFDDLRRGALNENTDHSVQKRRRWYSWGHMGTFAWRWDDRHHYPDRPSKRTPEIHGLDWRQWQRAGPIIGVCKHYCIRTVEQGIRRARERIERGGRWQFGKYASPFWIVDEKIAMLHHMGMTDDVWDTRENHSSLKAYLAGDHMAE